MILASVYLLLVVFAEIILFYLSGVYSVVGDFGMFITVGLFLAIAWMLKLKVPAVMITAVLIGFYGVLSFYSQFPIYDIDYPQSLEEFLPVIAIKVGYYIFPLILYIVIKK